MNFQKFSTLRVNERCKWLLQAQQEEDVRLSRILQKQKVYQQQLEKERNTSVASVTIDDSTATLTDAGTLDADDAGKLCIV